MKETPGLCSKYVPREAAEVNAEMSTQGGSYSNGTSGDDLQTFSSASSCPRLPEQSRLPDVCFYSGDGDGYQLEVNAGVGTPFENEAFAGSVLFLHRPDPEPSGYWPYHEHFEATRRRWEMRCQGVFKTDPGEVFFGVELADDMNLSRKRHIALKWIAKVVAKLAEIRGVQLHYSFDKVSLGDGSEVRPHIVAPLLGAQAVVVTPKGETPPSICDSFPQTPLNEKLQLNLNTDDTFTFCFWFQQLDIARWELCNLPMLSDRSLRPFIGDGPIHLTAYSTRRLESEGDPHAECNKKILVRMACSPPPGEPSEPSRRHPLRRVLSASDLSRKISGQLAKFPLFDRNPTAMPTVRLRQGDGEGAPIQVNSPVGIPFETDSFVGRVLFLQRPTPEPFHDNWPYAALFRPRDRRWELRCQGKFKKLPKNPHDIYFGAEMSQNAALTWRTRKVAYWVLKIAKMLAAKKGVWFDHAFELVRNDDGSRVLPHYVSPVFAAEAFYSTPPGEDPPDITGIIEQNPLAEKQRVDLNLEDTYTIGLWNKQLDFARWAICNMPLGWTSSFTPFIGEQPIHLVAYGLKEPQVEGQDATSVHSDTNKDYILRLEVSPPPTVSDWSCHRGLQTGVVLGHAGAVMDSFSEKMAPRITRRISQHLYGGGDGRDMKGSKWWCCFAWCR